MHGFAVACLQRQSSQSMKIALTGDAAIAGAAARVTWRRTTAAAVMANAAASTSASHAVGDDIFSALARVHDRRYGQFFYMALKRNSVRSHPSVKTIRSVTLTPPAWRSAVTTCVANAAAVSDTASHGATSQGAHGSAPVSRRRTRLLSAPLPSRPRRRSSRPSTWTKRWRRMRLRLRRSR